MLWDTMEELTKEDIIAGIMECTLNLLLDLVVNYYQIQYNNNVFRDNIFYDFLEGKGDILSIKELDRDKCLELFKAYSQNHSDIKY